MRKALWFIVAVLLVALMAPAAMADSYTYSFVGSNYFAGTVASFTTTSGPAVMGVQYLPNAGATDLFITYLGPTVDYGAIQYIFWEPSPFNACGGSSPCTVEMVLFTSLFPGQGPTIAGTSVPGPGTYAEFFTNGTLTVTATPEPSSSALMLCGLALVLFLAVRKQVS